MVRCSECGLLASRNVQSRQLEETERRTRDEGYVDTAYREAPICLARANDLWVESGITAQTVCYGNVDEIRLAIQKERICQPFVEWKQGFTPKEHQEMIDRKVMLEWQAKREEADRKWHSRQNWYLVIIAGIFTILGAILGVLLS